jgi:signal transduction histidine kinase
VAHEIRNPLVSIKAFAQLLPKHHHDPVFRERFSRVIVDEVGRIDRLTEQLLDLAAPHTYVKTPVALNTLIRTSLELVAARVSSRNMRLRTELVANPDLVFSDANGLKQVILNLCFNAVQAQETKPSESQIDVRLQTFNRGKNIELVVSDNGPGIQDDSRNHLFEPFHSTKSNGFGLGLTVCSEILSSLDSSISLDPYEPGKGAVFRVSLPCPPRSS